MKSQTVMMVRFGSLVALAAALAGCHAKPASVARDNVTATPMREFEAATQTLSNNKLFFYPEGLTPERFATLSRAARDYDRFEAQAFPYARRSEELNGRMGPLEQVIGSAKSRIAQIDRKLPRIDRDLARNQTDLDGVNERLQDPGLPADERAQLEGRLTALQATIARLSDEKVQLVAERAQKQMEVDRGEAEAAPLRAEFAEVEAARKPLSDASQEAYDNLRASVDWVSRPPSLVSFEYQGRQGGRAQFRVVVNGWAADEASGVLNSFSTDDGTIRDVLYRELGGRFTFDVYFYTDEAKTVLKNIYTFKIGRTAYHRTDDPSDGRIYYTGDLIEKDPQGRELRKGVAKLVDRSN